MAKRAPRRSHRSPWWLRWKELAAAITATAAVLALGWTVVTWAANASEQIEKVPSLERQAAEIAQDRKERRRVLEALCASCGIDPGVCVAEGIAQPNECKEKR